MGTLLIIKHLIMAAGFSYMGYQTVNELVNPTIDGIAHVYEDHSLIYDPKKIKLEKVESIAKEFCNKTEPGKGFYYDHLYFNDKRVVMYHCKTKREVLAARYSEENE